MVELQYFETDCKEIYILRKTTVKFIILIFGIFENFQHYMHRNISTLDRPARIWDLFYMKKAPSYIFDIFSRL